MISVNQVKLLEKVASNFISNITSSFDVTQKEAELVAELSDKILNSLSEICNDFIKENDLQMLETENQNKAHLSVESSKGNTNTSIDKEKALNELKLILRGGKK